MNEKNDYDIKYAASVCAFLFCTAMYAILMHYFGFYYDLNDDILMADILSGGYTGTPDAHNIQMMYPLAWVFKQLYTFFPQISWMGVIEIVLMWWCCVLLISRTHFLFAKHIESRWRRILGIVGLYASVVVFATGTSLWELVMVQYTVVCGFMAATAAFLVCTCEEFTVIGNIPAVILVILAFNIRSEMLLLLCPFLAAVGLIRWIPEGISIKTARKYLGFVGIMVLGICATLIVNKLAYSSEEWKEFDRLFNARTEVYDFTGIPSYEENKDFYDKFHADIDDYDRLVDYNYCLSNAVTATFMENMAQYADEHSVYKRSIPWAVFENIKQTGTWKTPSGRTQLNTPGSAFYEDNVKQHIPMNLIVVLFYGMVVVAAVRSKDIKWAYTLPILFVMRTISWTYVTYRGRINARITHPMYMTEILILVGVLLFAWIEGDYQSVSIKKAVGRILVTGWLIVTLIAAAFVPSTIVNDIKAKSEQREKNNVIRDAIYTYTCANPRTYYLLDVYSTVGFTQKIFGDTCYGKGNTQLAGGWAAKSPLDEYKSGFYQDKEEWRFISLDEDYCGWVPEETITASDGVTSVYVYKLEQ